MRDKQLDIIIGDVPFFCFRGESFLCYGRKKIRLHIYYRHLCAYLFIELFYGNVKQPIPSMYVYVQRQQILGWRWNLTSLLFIFNSHAFLFLRHNSITFMSRKIPWRNQSFQKLFYSLEFPDLCSYNTSFWPFSVFSLVIYEWNRFQEKFMDNLSQLRKQIAGYRKQMYRKKLQEEGMEKIYNS